MLVNIGYVKVDGNTNNIICYVDRQQAQLISNILVGYKSDRLSKTWVNLCETYFKSIQELFSHMQTEFPRRRLRNWIRNNNSSPLLEFETDVNRTYT